MCINRKIRPFQTNSSNEGAWIKENNWGVNSSMIYLIYFKNYVNTPQHNNTKRQKRSIRGISFNAEYVSMINR
jgi:hypothetical protein